MTHARGCHRGIKDPALIAEADALRVQGLSWVAISNRLHVSPGRIRYWVLKTRKRAGVLP